MHLCVSVFSVLSRLTNATLGGLALHCIKLCSICQQKRDPSRGLAFIIVEGLEPNKMQVSGGHLLQPVQKLVASTIFAFGENANRVRP